MLWTPKGALLCPTILLTSDFGDFGTSSQLDPVQPGTAWAEVGGGFGLQSPSFFIGTSLDAPSSVLAPSSDALCS